MSTHPFQALALHYIATAKSHFGETVLLSVNVHQLQTLLPLLAESISLDTLTDQAMVLHTFDGILAGHSNQCILMNLFLFSIHRLYSQGSQHPLEKGVLRQKIMALLPYFEKATMQGLIPTAIYDKNADALAHFAEDTEEVDALLKALDKAYTAHTQCNQP